MKSVEKLSFEECQERLDKYFDERKKNLNDIKCNEAQFLKGLDQMQKQKSKYNDALSTIFGH